MMHSMFVIASFCLLVANVSSQRCKCGVEKPTHRIIGGHLVNSTSKLPWLVMLTHPDGDQFCGGAIITSKCILTAAHCMKDEKPKTVKVVHGVLRLDQVNENNTIDVRKFIVHPDYDQTGNTENDIAIIVLKKAINLNKNPPICISKQNSHKQNYSTLCVAGWGDTSDGSEEGSEDLLEVCFTENDFETCNKQWDNSLNSTTQITAGANGKDSCQGDSGGPLYTKVRGRTSQVGIVSFGDKCGYPCSVYTRVTGFHSWILSTIRANNCGYRCKY